MKTSGRKQSGAKEQVAPDDQACPADQVVAQDAPIHPLHPLTDERWRIRCAGIERSDRDVRLEASEDECRKLAECLEIEGMDSLALDYRLCQVGGRRYRLNGDLRARLVQRCVVTTDPVFVAVDERLDVLFMSAGELAADLASPDFDPLEEQDREAILCGRIDIGTVVYEALSLGIDPFPRSEAGDGVGDIAGSATVEGEDAGACTGDGGPFAILKRLQEGGE